MPDPIDIPALEAICERATEVFKYFPLDWWDDSDPGGYRATVRCGDENQSSVCFITSGNLPKERSQLIASIPTLCTALPAALRELREARETISRLTEEIEQIRDDQWNDKVERDLND